MELDELREIAEALNAIRSCLLWLTPVRFKGVKKERFEVGFKELTELITRLIKRSEEGKKYLRIDVEPADSKEEKYSIELPLKTGE